MCLPWQVKRIRTRLSQIGGRMSEACCASHQPKVYLVAVVAPVAAGVVEGVGGGAAVAHRLEFLAIVVRL